MLQKPQGTNHHAIIQYFMHFIYLQLRPLSINLMPLDCERQHREAQWYTWRFRSCCEGTMLTSAISCFPWCRWYPRANTERHTISHSHFSTCVQFIITSKPNGLGFGLWEKSTLRRKQLSVWAKFIFYAYYQYCNYVDKVLEPICDHHMVRSALASSCRRTKDASACRIRNSHIW